MPRSGRNRPSSAARARMPSARPTSAARGRYGPAAAAARQQKGRARPQSANPRSPERGTYKRVNLHIKQRDQDRSRHKQRAWHVQKRREPAVAPRGGGGGRPFGGLSAKPGRGGRLTGREIAAIAATKKAALQWRGGRLPPLAPLGGDVESQEPAGGALPALRSGGKMQSWFYPPNVGGALAMPKAGGGTGGRVYTPYDGGAALARRAGREDQAPWARWAHVVHRSMWHLFAGNRPPAAVTKVDDGHLARLARFEAALAAPEPGEDPLVGAVDPPSEVRLYRTWLQKRAALAGDKAAKNWLRRVNRLREEQALANVWGAADEEALDQEERDWADAAAWEAMRAAPEGPSDICRS